MSSEATIRAWMDTAVEAIRRAEAAEAALAASQEENRRLREALVPFAMLSKAMDKLAVAGQRKLQPEAAASMSDDEIAALVTPDDNTLLTDGRMAFGGEQHRSMRVKVTTGDFRRAARSLSQDADATQPNPDHGAAG